MKEKFKRKRERRTIKRIIRKKNEDELEETETEEKEKKKKEDERGKAEEKENEQKDLSKASIQQLVPARDTICIFLTL